MEHAAQGLHLPSQQRCLVKYSALSLHNMQALFAGYLKLAIQKRLGLPSPFTVRLLKGIETLDDFSRVQEITDTNELHLEFLLQKKK